MSDGILKTIDGISKALAAAGAPPVSPWWRAQHVRFYGHPTARLLVACVGRGGDKSRTSVVMGCAETLAGDFGIARGERHYFVHVSENKDEAAKTLALYESYLRLIGVPFTRSGDAIELDGLPRGIRVLACRVGAVSGFRCFGWTADEAAKWSNDGVDPSEEVIASIRAMTVTHPKARGRMFSSPLGTEGYFHQTWSTGDTEYQIAAHAPSWVANPSVTESATKALEPHEPTWRREYAAIPSDGASSAFNPDHVAAMMRAPHAEAAALGAGALIIDSSSGRNDGWAFALVQYILEPGSEHEYLVRDVYDADGRVSIRNHPIYDDTTGKPIPNPKYRIPVRCMHVADLGAFEGGFSESLSFAQVVEHTASLARRCGVTVCFGDQYLSYALKTEYAKHGIRFVERAWSSPVAKVTATSHLRRLMAERSILVEPGPEAAKLQRELLSVRERFLPSGTLTVQAHRTGAGHADRASLLLLAARVDSEGDLAGSPIARSRQAIAFDSYGGYGQQPGDNSVDYVA